MGALRDQRKLTRQSEVACATLGTDFQTALVAILIRRRCRASRQTLQRLGRDIDKNPLLVAGHSIEGVDGLAFEPGRHRDYGQAVVVVGVHQVGKRIGIVVVIVVVIRILVCRFLADLRTGLPRSPPAA